MENRSTAKRVAVIGGGVAGLTAAWRLLERGASVTIYEAEPVLGGLASSFPLGDGSIERYYHFICLGDRPYRQAMEQLGILHRLRWRYTSMGQFHDGRIYSFGHPWDVFFFSPMRWRDKVRFGTSLMSVKRQPWAAWRKIDDRRADEWLVELFGSRTYELIYRPLIERKFGPYANGLSAAWIWARIHRLGKSRTRFLQLEKLGYLVGGSQALVDALAARIASHGCTVHLKQHVKRIVTESGSVQAVAGADWSQSCDAVLSTIPTPYLCRLTDGADRERLAYLDNIASIGVTCAVLRLTRRLTPFFWLNISDPRIPLVGVIEYTNLNRAACPDGDHIVYIPQYTPSDSEHFRLDDESILRSYTAYLKLIVPQFDQSWVRGSWVFRDRYAQPICTVGFSRQVAGITTPVSGLYLTDSHQLYPDDRTISNSIRLGWEAADHIMPSTAEARTSP
ncbi:MAG: NAD(P)/FAD-dependent oxidoreductase [Acidobacteriota bacterium]